MEWERGNAEDALKAGLRTPEVAEKLGGVRARDARPGGLAARPWKGRLLPKRKPV